MGRLTVPGQGGSASRRLRNHNFLSCTKFFWGLSQWTTEDLIEFGLCFLTNRICFLTFTTYIHNKNGAPWCFPPVPVSDGGLLCYFVMESEHCILAAPQPSKPSVYGSPLRVLVGCVFTLKGVCFFLTQPRSCVWHGYVTILILKLRRFLV